MAPKPSSVKKAGMQKSEYKDKEKPTQIRYSNIIAAKGTKLIVNVNSVCAHLVACPSVFTYAPCKNGTHNCWAEKSVVLCFQYEYNVYFILCVRYMHFLFQLFLMLSEQALDPVVWTKW